MPSVTQPVAVYLRNHEAAAQAGYDLFRRVASGQARRPYGADLRSLAEEAASDLRALQGLMKRVGVSSDPVLVTAGRLGERLGRLKPNGSLVTRAPLTDLIEIEGLIGAVTAKAAAWQALSSGPVPLSDSGAGTEPFELGDLVDRARSQLDRLQQIHRSVAATVLTQA